VTAATYVTFLGVALVLAVTPGPDTVVSLRYAVAARRSGLAAATGTSLAIFAWAGLVAVGVAALLRASDLVYGSLRVLGGAYLVVLGVRALAVACRSAASQPAASARGSQVQPDTATRCRTATQDPVRAAFASGVTTCLTNPKTGLFFIAVFPQFAPSGAGPLFVTVVLGGTVAVVVYAYLVSLVLAADAAHQRLARPRVTRTIELASGSVLPILGLGILSSALAEVCGWPVR
jgi:threonine/homoserine/homoserine lactone efflux protein